MIAYHSFVLARLHQFMFLAMKPIKQFLLLTLPRFSDGVRLYLNTAIFEIWSKFHAQKIPFFVRRKCFKIPFWWLSIRYPSPPTKIDDVLEKNGLGPFTNLAFFETHEKSS